MVRILSNSICRYLYVPFLLLDKNLYRFELYKKKKSMSRLFVIEQQRFVCNFFNLVKLGNFFADAWLFVYLLLLVFAWMVIHPIRQSELPEHFSKLRCHCCIVFFVVIEMEITRRSRRAEGKWFGEFLFVYSYCPLIREKSSS